MSDETKDPPTQADQSAAAAVEARIRSLIDSLPPEQREALLSHPARAVALKSLRDAMVADVEPGASPR